MGFGSTAGCLSSVTASQVIVNRAVICIPESTFALRKWRRQSNMFVVGRSVFLQYGTSARLAAPLKVRALLGARRKFEMPAPEFFPGNRGGAGAWDAQGLEERSLRRVRIRLIGFRTGWSRNPSSPGSERVRAPYGVRAECDRRGPQGKATVQSIVAGVC